MNKSTSYPEEFKIETKPGYTRASVGSMGWFEVSLLAAMGLAACLNRRCHQRI